MARYNRTPAVIPTILIIIGIIVAVIALYSVARMMLFPGNGTIIQDSGREALLSLAVDRKVVMTVRGPIVADEDFRSYQIIVTPDERKAVLHTGYQNQVLESKTFKNNTPAYEQFVYALDKANLTKGTALTGDSDDTRGLCATGKLYEFQIINGDDLVKRLWTTSCSSNRGSLDGKLSQLTKLFNAQIPNYKSIVGNL